MIFLFRLLFSLTLLTSGYFLLRWVKRDVDTKNYKFIFYKIAFGFYCIAVGFLALVGAFVS